MGSGQADTCGMWECCDLVKTVSKWLAAGIVPALKSMPQMKHPQCRQEGVFLLWVFWPERVA